MSNYVLYLVLLNSVQTFVEAESARFNINKCTGHVICTHYVLTRKARKWQ